MADWDDVEILVSGIAFVGNIDPNGSYTLSWVSEGFWQDQWRYESPDAVDYGVEPVEPSAPASGTIKITTFPGTKIFWQEGVLLYNGNIADENEDEEYGGSVTLVSGFFPPKAINPTPTTGAVNVSKNITTFLWEIPA